MFGLRRLCLLNGISPLKCSFFAGKRLLCSSSTLGLDEFMVQRQKTLESLSNVNQVRMQLQQLSEKTSKAVVFLEDLRKMTGIAECEEDFEVLLNLVKKYCTQKTLLVFQNYSFCTEVMRLLYVHNRYEQALEIFNDAVLFPHFCELTALTVLLDLLFNNGEYEEVIRIFEKSVNENDRFMSSISSVIFVAACYKLNTPECLEKAFEVHKQRLEKYQAPSLRISLLFAALAIKQNQPVYAIEAFHAPTYHSLIQNLKCMAYAQGERFETVLETIKDDLKHKNYSQYFITSETISFIENEISKSGKFNLEFEELKQELLANNVVVNETLDKYLLQEIDRKPSSRMFKGSFKILPHRRSDGRDVYLKGRSNN